MLPSFDVARKLQAACAVARSFLGPHKAFKCVIDDQSDSRSCLAGSAQAFLLAAEGDPTATTLLLEAMESQAPSSADAPGSSASAPIPGSGATWQAVFCGLLLQYSLELVEGQEVPYESVRSGVLQAVAECCEAVRGCALELSLVAERWDELDLMSYSGAVSALLQAGDGCRIAGVVGRNREQMPAGNSSAGGVAASSSLATNTSAAATTAAATDGPVTSGTEQSGTFPPPLGGGGNGGGGAAGCADSGAVEGSSGASSGNAGVTAACEPGGTSLRGGQGASDKHGQGGGLDTPGNAAEDNDEFGWFDDMMSAATAGAAAAPTSKPTAAPPALPLPPQHRYQQHQHRQQQEQQQPPPRATLRSSLQTVPSQAGHLGAVSSKSDSDDDGFGWFDSLDASTGGMAAAKSSSGGVAVEICRTPMPTPADESRSASSRNDGSLRRGGSVAPPGHHAHRANGGRQCRTASECGEQSYPPRIQGSLTAPPSSGDDNDDDSKSDIDGTDDVRGRGSGDRSGGSTRGLVGSSGSCSSDDAAISELEEAAAWFFGEGELEAERAARRQRRELRRLGVRLEAMGRTTEAAAGVPPLGQQARVAEHGTGRQGAAEAAETDVKRQGSQGVQGGEQRLQGAPWREGAGGCGGQADARLPLGIGGDGRGPELDEGGQGVPAASKLPPLPPPPPPPLQPGLAVWTPPEQLRATQQQPTQPLHASLHLPGPQSQPAQATAAAAPPPASRLSEQGRETPSPCGQGRYDVVVSRAGSKGGALDPLTRLVCSAASGLAHGRHLEMHLAAAAVLLLLRPLVRQGDGGAAVAPVATCNTGVAGAAGVVSPSPSALPGDGDYDDMAAGLAAVSERVRRAAAGIKYERSVLTAELMGRAAVGTVGASYGVCVPLATLSPEQATLASEFFSSLARAKSSAQQQQQQQLSVLHSITAVFYHGAIQPDHATHGSVVITDAAGVGHASTGAREERYAARMLVSLRPHLKCSLPHSAEQQPRQQEQQPQPPPVTLPRPPPPKPQPPAEPLLLIVSGHVPDRLAALLYELSGGVVLALGSVGLRAVRAAAACCGVTITSHLAFLTSRSVARGVRAGLAAGGLDLRDYRPGAGGARGAGCAVVPHVQPGVMLRLLAAADGGSAEGGGSEPGSNKGPLAARQGSPAGELNTGGSPGWVTVVLAHPVGAQLEAQAAAFRTCFNRLVAALRSGRVLPGAGAWELAAAEHLSRRAQQLERQRASDAEAEVGAAAADAGAAGAAAAAIFWEKEKEATRMKGDMAAATPGEGGAAARPGVSGWRQVVAEAQALAAEQDAIYQPLSYRAVAAALRDVVHVLLQNGGCMYGDASAAAAAAAQALRYGDVAALRRLAASDDTAPAVAAAVGPQGAVAAPSMLHTLSAPAATVGIRPAATAAASAFEGRDSGPSLPEPGWPDERRQLAASLAALLELKDVAGAGQLGGRDLGGGVSGPSAGREVAAGGVARGTGFLMVLDELGAREAAVSSGCQLALMAASVDTVIVNR